MFGQRCVNPGLGQPLNKGASNIGKSLMSMCSGFPVSLSTILMPKGESELR